MVLLPALSLAVLAGCGPSRQDLAGLERILEKNPFPRSDLDFTDALTALPALATEGTVCEDVFQTDLEKARRDMEIWPSAHPDVVGRRGTVKSRWLPLQVGRVTIARSPGTAAAQGSASHAARAYALKNFEDTPGVSDLSLNEKLTAALALHERELEPELVVIVQSLDHVEAWLYDPIDRRMVCGGPVSTATPSARDAFDVWVQPNPPRAPELADVEALTRRAVAGLLALPEPEVAEPEAAEPEVAEPAGAAPATAGLLVPALPAGEGGAAEATASLPGAAVRAP